MQFRNNYLSNMYPCTIELYGIRYSCSEALFQSIKLPLCKRNIFANKTGAEAKRLGENIKQPKNWDYLRINAMRTAVYEKFKQNPILREKLIATGDEYLQEEGDPFWGVLDGKGENMLGKILMQTRERFKIP